MSQRDTYLINFVHECGGGDSWVDFATLTGNEAAEVENYLKKLADDGSVSDVFVSAIPPAHELHSFEEVMKGLRAHFEEEDTT